MRRPAAGFLVAALLVVAAPAPAASVAGAQFRYWAFKDGNDNRNPILYYAPGPFHVQLEVWDFVRGTDQFRPEIGLHLRDLRRSTYSIEWRHEQSDERLTLGTEQILAKGFVAKGSVSPLINSDSTAFVYEAGLDCYFKSWDFASVDVIHDPRGDDLWTVPVRLRLATEQNDWVQFLVAPASRRTLGWAVDTRIKGVRLGVERNERFDFSTRDNIIYTIGYEVSVPSLPMPFVPH
jgi:hypothetical protein